MKRKLIRQGGGRGLTFYVPSDWVAKQALSAGQEISIEPVGDSLLLSAPSQGRKLTSICINSASDLPILLSHLYRNGFDKIAITYSKDVTLKHIEDYVQDTLLGFEVTERKQQMCVIENVTEPSDSKFDVLMRRIFLLIKELQKIIHYDYTHNSFTQREIIDRQRQQLDKYVIYCKRSITRNLLTKLQPMLFWELLKSLMVIHHALYYLYDYMEHNKHKQHKDINELLDHATDYFDLFYRSYYHQDRKYINEINTKKLELYTHCFETMKKHKGENVVIIAHIREILRLIQLGSSPILSLLVHIPECSDK